MKLLAVRMARAVWLTPSYFLNPKGIFVRPIINAMKAKYSFLKTPLDVPFPFPSEGIKFEQGVFNGKNGAVQIINLTLHNDGILIDTRSSTDDADSFMEDVIAWVNKEYGMPPLSALPIKRIYVSELNVMFQKPPAIFNPKLAPLLAEISAAIADKAQGNADFLSLQLSTDPTRTNRQSFFRVDREINTSFDEGRYYSFASAKTDAHIRLLEMLETLAA